MFSACFPVARPALIAVVLTVLCLGSTAATNGPLALPEGKTLKDARHKPLKDLEGYFPFEPPRTSLAWRERTNRLRDQLLVSLGLWPMPTRTPLNAVIHGRIERDDYTVEKVFFESAPGFFVTGNLYRPKGGAEGRRPAMLCPHGHWPDGRFLDVGTEAVRKEIAAGAERFEEGGRSVLQARCVGLARLGCVVFHYDMLGYADSQQIPLAVAHEFAKQRPEMNTAENWGLFSPQAEAHLQSVMGLQTWNSIRALDFLLSLPDVDPKRVGVTGASGGGTQSFILGALEPRLALAFPAVMVSTAMQGGCTCENASNLRVGTGNVEFAGIFAPNPLGMTTANDWTREMATKGYPALHELYRVLGAPDNVMLHRGEQFPHNYNAPSRVAMYDWVNRHFALDLPEPIAERDYLRLSREEMSVWSSDHPQPPGGPDFERQLLRWFHEDAAHQLKQSASAPAQFRKLYGRGLEMVIGRTWDEVGKVEWSELSKVEERTHSQTAGVVRNVTHEEKLPAVLLVPKHPKDTIVLWLHPAGKTGLFASNQPIAEVRRLLQAGVTVAAVDLLGQGEATLAGQPLEANRRVANPREVAAYTYGYNPALFAQRVHDVLTAVRWLEAMQPGVGGIEVIGLRGAGVWAAAARAVAREHIARMAIDTAGFRFGHVEDLWSAEFLPGGAKYGDVPGMLAVGAPGPTWVAGEDEADLALARRVYSYSGNQRRFSVFPGTGHPAAAAAVKWILKE